MTYSAVITKGASRSRGVIEGEIYEHDVQIGTFRRGAIRSHFVPPIESKFFSTQARSRFVDFADSLSIGETVEALAFSLEAA